MPLGTLLSQSDGAGLGRVGQGLLLFAPGSHHEVGHRLVFVDAQIMGVSADKAFVEDAAGKLVELFLFQGLQAAAGDLGGLGDFLQRDAAHLTLALQAFAEGAHSCGHHKGGGWGVSTARSAKSYGNKDFGHGPMVTEVCPAADIFCPLGKPEAIMRPPAFAVTVHLSMTEATASGKRQIQELNIFHDVAKALTSSLNLDSILQTIMDKMAEYFRPDNWSLLMVEEKKQELYFAIAVGEAAETLKNLRLKVGEGIAGWVAKHGESLIVPDVYNDPRFAKRVDEMTKWQTRSIICVPLRARHRVLGVIQLINCSMETFGNDEMFFLHALCDYAAIAIDNARAVEKIQELTITDDVTGLFNARHLYKTLEAEVYRSARFGYEFSVLFIDLDHFKRVNDTHGHLVGQQAADRGRLPSQAPPAPDRLRLPLWRGRVRHPAAADQQGLRHGGRPPHPRRLPPHHFPGK